MNLLIVDDEMPAIMGILDDVPWDELRFDDIFTANSYAQAVNIFRNHRVDILMCDIEMPMGSGIDLVKWVREHYPYVECIFLTCHADFFFAKEALKLSCLDYLLKPADTQEIVDVLQKARKKIMEENSDTFYKEQGKLYLNHMKEEQSQPEPDSVEEVERYIQTHLSEQFGVEDLAEIAHMSATHLGRLFKKRHGLTLVDYITKQRMEMAKDMLKDKSMSVSMVAAKVGFNNYSYFTRTFGKYTGKSPREYRHEYLHNKD